MGDCEKIALMYSSCILLYFILGEKTGVIDSAIKQTVFSAALGPDW